MEGLAIFGVESEQFVFGEFGCFGSIASDDLRLSGGQPESGGVRGEKRVQFVDDCLVSLGFLVNAGYFAFSGSVVHEEESPEDEEEEFERGRTLENGEGKDGRFVED